MNLVMATAFKVMDGLSILYAGKTKRYETSKTSEQRWFFVQIIL
jgi:hypothetical protein